MHVDATRPSRPDEQIVDRMTRVRRAIHRRPELSNAEHATQALLASELAELRLGEVHEIAGTGLRVDVAGDPSGPVVVVRADMDALPVQETSALPFASEVPGVMHACGHDAHSAMALGAAALAAAARDELVGTLRFIFQPAEEVEPLGGRRVVAEGHLDGVAAAVALHVDPGLDTGVLGLRPGPSMASADEFTITVVGRGGHAGWPDLASDAIAAAAAIVGELQKVVSRRVDPRAAVVVHVGTITGGTAPNVVADRVVMSGTVRTLSPAARDAVHALIRGVSESTARAGDAHATVEIVRGEPVLENHPGVIDAFAAARGADGCRWLDHSTMNSEDFAFYTERVPAAMAWIGVRPAGAEAIAPLHHPDFALDERVLPAGAAVLFDTASALLSHPPAAGASR